MTTKDCVHHYLCEEPNGEFADAVCKKCGHETKFRNSPDFKVFNSWRGATPKKSHGMTKEQLTKQLKSEGKKLPDFPRLFENKEKEPLSPSDRLQRQKENKRRSRVKTGRN